MKNRVICLAAIVSLFFVPHAAIAQSWTPELIWSLGQPVLMDASADGTWALYGILRYDLEKDTRQTDLYRIRVNGSTKGRPEALTATEADESWAQFHPNGDRIGFLRDNRLWVMDADGQNARQVAEIPIVFFQFSPDGEKILYATGPETTPQGGGKQKKARKRKAVEAPLRNDDPLQLYIASLEGDRLEDPFRIRMDPYELFLGAFIQHRPFGWSANGRKIAFSGAKKPVSGTLAVTNYDIFLYDLDQDTLRLISDAMPGQDTEPIFSPSGRYLAWVSTESDRHAFDRTRIFIADLISGRKWEMTTSLDREAWHPRWYKDDSRMFFIAADLGTWQLFEVNFQSGGKLRQRSNGFGDFQNFVFSGDLLIAARSFLTQPDELFRLPVDMGTIRQFTNTNPTLLDSLDLPKLVKRRVLSSDGVLMNAWVLQPPGFDKQKTYPAILYCADGPHTQSFHQWRYDWNLPLLAAQGYVVIAPARRGVRGYNQKWTDGTIGDWSEKPLEDLFLTADTFRQEPFIDAARMAAIGEGYGGASVYWLAGKHPELFKTVVAGNGIFNLQDWYAAQTDKNLAHFELGGAPDERTDSPHQWVDKWSRPLLILHDESRTDITLSQSESAYQEARRSGLETSLLSLPGPRSTAESPQKGIALQRRLVEWLEEHLKE